MKRLWSIGAAGAVVYASPAAGQERPAQPVESQTQARAAGASVVETARDFLDGLVITGYVQGQYERHQDSDDQVRQGGQLLNQNRFSVRRGRLKIDREWEYADAMVELDANTTRGPAVVPQHAEASVQLRGKNALPLPPMLRLTFGIFDVPFGYELVESPRDRYFMERSQGSRAFFPGEPDVGFRLTSAVGWLRTSVAVVNGQPINDTQGFALRDPNSNKDIIARAGADFEPLKDVKIAGGASVLNGKGFHKGTDATKNSVAWKDANENGQVDLGELTPVPGTAATPSQNFDRWCVSGDLRVGVKTPAGWTRAYGEIQIGSNMDRGLYVADPVITNTDTREVAYMFGLTQELFQWGVIGFRFDLYNPNSDSLDRQGGKLLPSTQTIKTYSPMVGLTLPKDRARLLFQYDVTRDYMGRDPRGVPADLENNAWTLRLQVAL